MDGYNIMQYALDKISKCRYSNKRSRQHAEKGIALLESVKDEIKDYFYAHNYDRLSLFHTRPRGLIYYPDLLAVYIKIVPVIGNDDLSSMFCRCIETDVDYSVTLNILLNYVKEKNITDLELLLLPNKYKINTDAYSLCKENGIRDIFYEWSLNKSTPKPEYHHNLDTKK